jgi:16S rRNA (uracil1498-N3)-methyltransferase
MTAPVFLVDAATAAARGVGDAVELSGAEGRHAVSVRRVGPGERLDLVDGAGTVLHVEVEQVLGRDALSARVLGREVVAAPSPRIVVVQALPKAERAETAVETLTEVGVDVIVPWQAQRCVARWTPDRRARAHARWVGVARAAAKQSRRAWLPEVRPLAQLDDVAALVAGAARAVVLHEGADESLGARQWPPAGDVVLVVGPEGGLAPEELDRLARAGGIPARMGPTVLRTSTAGTVAVGVVLAATARWR